MNETSTSRSSNGLKPTLRLRVSRVAESMVRSGHPWVFSDSVRETNRAGESGELAVIYDRNDRFLAVGFYDPDSPIRVRVLHAGKPCRVDDAWFEERLKAAMALREPLAEDETTTGYRLVNGESDGWPALVLDRYGAALVLKLYAAAWLQRLEMLTALITRVLAPERVVLRLSRNIKETAERDFAVVDGQVLSGPSLDGGVTFLENGIRFEADVVRGQKTGFFLDQRENRKRIEALTAGRRVLNAFSFSGGFSLYAARGGARSVTDVDISAHALESAQRNFALNDADAAIQRCEHRCVKADVFEWLRSGVADKFDLIVLDPPSLARRESERARAIEAYGRLVSDAMPRLAKGGGLYAASCSAHVSAEEFFGAVRTAVQRSGRRLKEMETTGHAADHPATFEEARYLKGIFFG